MKREGQPWWALAALILGLVLCLPMESWAEEEGVQNVRHRVVGQKIHVSYDLVGEGDYTVALRLLEGTGEAFAAFPRSVSGAVGKGVRPGKGKKIVWEVLKDVEELEGDDFVFEVRAVRPGGTSKWVWIGGAGVAAGVAAALLGAGDDTGTIVIDVPDPEG